MCIIVTEVALVKWQTVYGIKARDTALVGD